MEAIFGRRGSWQRTASRARWIALLTAALGAYCADARPPAMDVSGQVSIADGPPFTIVRGDSLWTGSKGVTLVAGDIVETGPGAFVVIETREGDLVGIGPSSQVYFLQRTDVATLVVLKGWLKADVRAKGKPGAVRVIGTRLGIQAQEAVVLLCAGERSDAIFDEQGSAVLVLHDRSATRVDKETKPNQFFNREDRAAVVLQRHPPADFVTQMPVAFRDALPEKASAGLQKPSEPKLVRKVTYGDIQSWLTMPRDWRDGFIGRFRSRLRDPAFFSAMDARLAQHPEWIPILHPPRDRARPLSSPPDAAPTTFFPDTAPDGTRY